MYEIRSVKFLKYFYKVHLCESKLVVIARCNMQYGKQKLN